MSALLPQLDISTYYSQIFWLVVVFVSLYFSLSRVFIPNISNLMERRKKYIEDIEVKALNEEESVVLLEEFNKELFRKAKEDSDKIIGSANSKVAEIVAYNNELISKNLVALDSTLHNQIKSDFDSQKDSLKSDCNEYLKIVLDKFKINELNKEDLDSLSNNVFEKIFIEKYKKFKG